VRNRSSPISHPAAQPFSAHSHLSLGTPQFRGICSSDKEITMVALTGFSRKTQRALCLLVAVVVVAASLSFGAYKTHSAFNSGYTVTVTQLQ
jgi:hypothetical protein